MILLDLARTGRTRTGHVTPEPVRPLLLAAGLRIIAATMLAPYVHWRPLSFPVRRVTDAADVRLTEQIELSGRGILGGKLEWIGQMRDGFSLVSQAAAWLGREYCPHAAREVWDTLARCNLLLGVVEAVRARADLDYVAELMTDRIDDWLAAFSDYAILPPETLGWIVAAHKHKVHGIPRDASAWKHVAAAAFETWDQAEPHAARARRATSLTELLEASLSCFPYYEGSVRLFYEAMRRYAQAQGEQPAGLMRDFRVVEEFRVGALELLRYLGHHLISRVGMFLQHGVGLPVAEAVRKALNAARAEISVFPDVIRTLWLEAAKEVGPEVVYPSETWWETSSQLESWVEDRVPAVFSDSEVVRCAFQIHRETWPSTTLDLELEWQDRLLGPAMLLTPSPVESNALTRKHHEMPAEELIRRLILGRADSSGE